MYTIRTVNTGLYSQTLDKNKLEKSCVTPININEQSQTHERNVAKHF